MRKARIACILMSKFNDFRLNPAMNEREKCCEEALELLDEAGGKKLISRCYVRPFRAADPIPPAKLLKRLSF